MDLETGALLAQTELHVDLSKINRMDMPEGISEKQWRQVKKRAAALEEHGRLYEKE